MRQTWPIHVLYLRPFSFDSPKSDIYMLDRSLLFYPQNIVNFLWHFPAVFLMIPDS